MEENWRFAHTAWPLKSQPQRELNIPRSTRARRQSDIGVDLDAAGLKAGRCVPTGKLRVVPGVEQLGAEQEQCSFREYEALANRDVPVVDAGTVEDIRPGVPESPLAGRATAAALK